MALIAALVAASLTADPASLVLGRDKGAQLSISAPAGATVKLSASVGTIGEVHRQGDTFHARFNAPPLKAPTVALLLAQVDHDGVRELAWLSIPLSGSDTMEIETRPGSQVQADVAGTVIGPVIADKSGTARLPMIVPPGVNKATVHITDKLGNVSDKPLDLDPPPFSRVRMASRVAQANAASPLELEIFVVRPDGSPDDDAKLEVTSGDGEVEVRRRVGPGVYLAQWLAPAGKSGVAHVGAKANGQLAAPVEVPVSAARVAIARPFWRSALVDRQPWSVSVGLLGGLGSSFDGAFGGTVLLEASMRLEILPLEALFDLGGSWFSEVVQYGANSTNAERAKAQSRLVQVGLRLGRQIIGGLDGHAALLFGLQSQLVSRTLPTGVQLAQDGWTPRFGLALGANYQLGPGRALAQLQFDSSASGVAGLAGSLSSVQVMLGYLVTVR